MTNDVVLKAIALNCTLKRSPSESSTDVMLNQIAEQLQKHNVSTETIRIADYDVHPGVTHDEGNGDQWPQIKERILAADILVFGQPIWMGAPSSISKRVAERLDALLSDADDNGRYPTFGKVAFVAIVGNEDGAHHSSAELFQWLNDVGYTIPATAAVYWVGEAMGSTDFKDLPKTPDKVASVQAMAVSNAVHLSRLLKAKEYPGVPS
jgi:multimeric flavodoxin WrbA